MVDEAQNLLQKYPPEVAATAMRLREVVRKTVPRAHESVKLGWKAIMFGTGDGMKSVFCVIHPEREWVNLAFSKGTELPDPSGLLEGTGKRIKHVKVRSPKEAQSKALVGLIRSAAALAREA